MTSFAQTDIDIKPACFTFSGARELVSADRAKELLIGIASDVNFTSVNLSNKSYSDEAAIIIGAALANHCESVTSANLSDMIAGRQEEEALRALKSLCDGLANSKLAVLECDDNAMGKPGVIACETVLRQKTLTHLSLMNDGLSGEAAEQLATILLGYPEEAVNCPPLETFHYHNNMSGDTGAIAIARIVRCCSKLRNFRFSTTRSKQKGCLHIAQALDALDTALFEHLDLSDNSFGGACAKALASFLLRQTRLLSLTLRDSGLGEQGIQQLSNALKIARPPLQKLDLSGNDIETEIGDSLVTIVKSVSHTLEELYLDDNSFGTEVGSQIATALKDCKKLRKLSVNSCDLTALGAYRIAKSVSGLPVFITLEMDGNQICANGVECIKAVMNAAKKNLVTMEDNDEDGDDDLEDELDNKEAVDTQDADADLVNALAAAKLI